MHLQPHCFFQKYEQSQEEMFVNQRLHRSLELLKKNKMITLCLLVDLVLVHGIFLARSHNIPFRSFFCQEY